MFCSARLALLLFTLLASAAFGQSLQGVFSGTVSDPSGAAIPGANVTITNRETSVLVWSGQSDEHGLYRAPAIPAGVYNLRFEATGFKLTEIRDVSLTIDARAQVNAKLEIGALSEQVTVVGESMGQLKTDSSSMDEVIQASQVRNLPLPNRDILNALTLIGGVSSGGAATGINNQQLSINGSRTLNTEIMVDGTSVVSGTTGSVTKMPSTEAIRELKVLTSAYSAEYGRTSGGYINAVVDSGTNSYHGAGYEYFRNEALNANNYFNNARLIARPRDRYNQFGGKIGGPLTIPKLYQGREKTFFFFNYEGVRIASPLTPTSTLPDNSFRKGDFSASPIIIRDPLSRQPFPGNVIPDGRIDSAARKMLTQIPTPNASGSIDAANGRSINNYVLPQSLAESYNDITTRVDHNSFGSKGRTFFRLTRFDSVRPAGETIPGPLTSLRGPETIEGWQTSLGHTHMVSPSVLLEGHFGFNRANQSIDPPSLGMNVADVYGIQRTPTDTSPRFNITGWSALGTDSNTYRRQITNTFQTSGSLSWSKASNLLKVGGQLRKNQYNVFNPGGNFAGVYDITGDSTHVTNTAGNPVNAWADFLLGSVKSSIYALPQPMVGRRNWNLALFLQDDWKLTRKLTMNLGLRYEYEAPVTISNDIYSRIDDSTGKLLAAGKNASRSLNMVTPKWNFGPRIGFAYSLTPNTVIRAAAGSFFGQIFSNMGGVVSFPGYTVTQSFLAQSAGVSQPFKLYEGMPLIAVQDLNDPFRAEREATVANPLTTAFQFADVSSMSQTYQWNFGIQRMLPGAVLADASYVASRGLHLPLILPGNNPPFANGDELRLAIANGGANVLQLARPFKTVSAYSPSHDAGTSTYHSLQVKATRQFASSLSFISAYTFSKSIDDGSGLWPSSQPNGVDNGQFPLDFRRLDRAVSAFDRTHNLSAALSYTTRGAWWLRDWEIAPFFVARTGLPDTITQTNLHPAVTQQRPTDLSSGSLYLPALVNDGTAIRQLVSPTSASFSLAPTGPLVARIGGVNQIVLPFTMGSLGRNTLRNLGEVNLDLGISRRFPVSERVVIKLRAEAFNLFNHTNFNAAASALAVTADSAGRAVWNSPGFGLITSSKAARFMQLVLRVEF